MVVQVKAFMFKCGHIRVFLQVNYSPAHDDPYYTVGTRRVNDSYRSEYLSEKDVCWECDLEQS